MARLVLSRFASLVLTLLVASVVIYGALYLAPGDPSTLLAGNKASPATLAAIRDQWHLDDPIVERYGRWLAGVVRGDLGESFTYKEPVGGLIRERLGTTALLIGYAFVLVLAGGLLLGIAGALHPRLGAGITVLTSIGIATPAYVAAILLITGFVVELGWFPLVGDGVGLLDRLEHLTLPAVALALAWVAYVAQLDQDGGPRGVAAGARRHGAQPRAARVDGHPAARAPQRADPDHHGARAHRRRARRRHRRGGAELRASAASARCSCRRPRRRTSRWCRASRCCWWRSSWSST